jgi:hypothetical protein
LVEGSSRPLGFVPSMRDLLRISQEATASSPVFIIGEARSGTSILYRTLQKHPVFHPRKIDLTETHIFELLKRTFLFRRTYPESLLRYMLYDDVIYADFLRTIRPIRISSFLSILPNFIADRSGSVVWRLNLGHLLLRSYFFHAARARRCERIVEKTPTNTPYINQLTDAFPECRLIYVHRHPVDVFSSYRRRARDDPAAGWADIDIDGFCHSYTESVDRVLRWRESGKSNLMLVRYESFTRQPAEVFAAVCDFVGEQFEATAVREPQPQPGRWRGDPHLWGEIAVKTKDWRTLVSAEEASTLQRNLAPTMDRLGYDAYR